MNERLALTVGRLARVPRRAHLGDGSKAPLIAALGESFRSDDLCFKRYPVARQALAAVEACRELSRAGGGETPVDPSEIEDILVEVPAPQRAVIDRPGVPETRFQSIVSVQYQSALAIVAPDSLFDVARSPLFVTEALTRLMSRIRVQSAAELEPHFPVHWPARVSLQRGTERFEREILRPRGDAETDFGWDDVVAKYRKNPFVAELAPSIHRLHEVSVLPRFTH